MLVVRVQIINAFNHIVLFIVRENVRVILLYQFRVAGVNSSCSAGRNRGLRANKRLKI